jgi:hypothetical protein
LKKNKSLKVTSIALLIIVLLCSNISIQANKSIDPDIRNNEIYNDESYSSSVFPLSLIGSELILQENFTDGYMPPVDPVFGRWEHKITASNATWYVDNSNPSSDPYCATVHRGDYDGLQDEWLITPSIDLRLYDVIKLRFRWYTSHLTAVWNDVIDLSVGISVDDGWTWTVIWNEDDLEDPFVSWTWLDSGDIDLTDYADEADVKISFRYFSNDIEDAYAQEFSIDDIEIYGDYQEFKCDAGGPYEIAWSWNILNGVQFHGSAEGGQLPYVNWTWDFGDGNTSKIHHSPKWTYNDVGTYNVTLTVIDSATPNNIAVNHTTVKVIETAPTCVEITIQPSIGLIADVRNTGTLNVSHLNWTMSIEWGPSYVLHREVGNGIISFIQAKSFTLIRSSYNIIWSGFIKAIIEVKPLNACRVELQQKILVIGPFVFPVQSC